MPIQDNDLCFACGSKNPIGLHAQYKNIDGTAQATLIIHKDFHGWENIIHGGIVTTLLDESMAKACIFANQMAVTRTLEVKFKRPVVSNVPVTVTGRIKETRGPLIFLSAEIKQDGIIKASAEATFAVMNDA